MPPIYLAANGRFHAFPLASEFARMGHLGGLYAADHHILPPPAVPAGKYHNRWELKLWRSGARISGFPFGYSLERSSRLFDRWLIRQLVRESGGILHGWNSHVSRTLQDLDPAKWLRCVERSCPHNQFQHDVLLREGDFTGVPYQKDPEFLAASIQELYDADVIITPSQYSARTFVDPELRAKVRINPLGGNFPCRARLPKSAPLRVLLVGNAFLRKGTHYLIEAFKLISDASAELWIRGEVPAAYRRRIDDPRVKILSRVSGTELDRLYREATLFCLPSVDEGFGMVALEAISHGLPIIYTENCGVADILQADVGRKVPIRSPEALASAIDQVRGWTADDFCRFDLARATVLAENTWGQCAERMISSVYVR